LFLLIVLRLERVSAIDQLALLRSSEPLDQFAWRKLAFYASICGQHATKGIHHNLVLHQRGA
jgi:hypothetical protein